MKIVLILSLLTFNLFAKESVDKVVAIVNSEPVLQSELSAMPARAKKEGGLDDALLLDESADKIKSDSTLQLNYLIREKLVESEVKRLNLIEWHQSLMQDLRYFY